MGMSAVRSSAVCLIAAALLPLSGANGQTSQLWIGSSNGWWDSYINWFPGNEPSGSSYTEYRQTSAYTIRFRGDGNADSVLARFGDITFNLSGYTLNLLSNGATNPGLQVGGEPNDNARVTIRGGTVRAVSAGIADHGYAVTDRPSGYLGVLGPGARLELTGDLGVGHSGPGVLEVRGGGVVTSSQFGMVAGWIPGANGMVRVADAGSTLVARDMYIGQEGRGRVLVDVGGTLASSRGVIFALNTTADGLITVRGAGSRWTHTREVANSQISIGTAGPGALAVLAGGVFASDETVRVRAMGRLYGDGTVIGNILSDGLVSPGGSYVDATNEIAAAGVATLTVQGAYTQSSTGVLAIDLGTDGSHDTLAVSGAASLNGTLRLTFVDGYTPARGDTFVIATGSGVSGTFSTVVRPALPAGVIMRVAYAPGQVLVRFLPCPADLGSQGGEIGSDGRYDNNDLIAFISLFFDGDPRADFGSQGGFAGPDGVFSNDDFVVFINTFFVACP